MPSDTPFNAPDHYKLLAEWSGASVIEIDLDGEVWIENATKPGLKGWLTEAEKREFLAWVKARPADNNELFFVLASNGRVGVLEFFPYGTPAADGLTDRIGWIGTKRLDTALAELNKLAGRCDTCQGAKHLQNDVTGEIILCPKCVFGGIVDKSLIPGQRWA